MASQESQSAAPKLFTRAQVAERTDSKETWLIIQNSVYDVTNFLNEHPGGEEVLLEQSGRDATEPFEDVGHSSDARKMMEPFKVGEIVEEERISANDQKSKSQSGNADDENSSSWRSWVIPIALGVLATLVYRYFINTH